MTAIVMASMMIAYHWPWRSTRYRPASSDGTTTATPRTDRRAGMLGYLASDGRPWLAPVWFVVDEGQLAINTGKNTARGRAITRDPRLVMCLDDPTPP